MSFIETTFKFGTKAETLERIGPLLETIRCPQLFYFTVTDWRTDAQGCLSKARAMYADAVRMVVRSSAQGEDRQESSMAGAYCSVLNVTHDKLTESIETVIKSYGGHGGDQVLIQPMISDIAVSGVIMTRNLEDGAPYYVINYDDLSGKTDSITGGVGVHKTVLVSRDCDEANFDSRRLKAMVRLAKDVEKITRDTPVDIEFALGEDLVPYLFQVRPISVCQNWDGRMADQVRESIPHVERLVREQSARQPGIYGDRTILANMSDWNPAEMIGVHPDPLAASLYRELITKYVWQRARAEMGYYGVDAELMTFLYGQPYIDVRLSFNSFLPEDLSTDVSGKLVNAWLDRLDRHPELHDKVEFDVAQTCLDFSFDRDLDERYPGLLNKAEREEFRTALRTLTQRALTLDSGNTLSQAMERIRGLAERQRQERHPTLKDLVEECKLEGTLPFSMIARHAFIAEKILRSAVESGALTEERLQQFKTSVHTVTSAMAGDLKKVAEQTMPQEEFLKEYGHLRPGTYDIQSLSYRDRSALFAGGIRLPERRHTEDFELNPEEARRLNALLAGAGLTVAATDLLVHARLAIEGREYAKFVFTRNISEILEMLVGWGERHGYSREDLACLTIHDFLSVEDPQHLAGRIAEVSDAVRREQALSRHLKLSYLIRGVRDIYIVPLHRSAPNFIGQVRITGETVILDAHSGAEVDIEGKIVCIENADPGFDWIFTKGLKALITKFGGANSHMAIRCAEFGLPAAIGCGEEVFQRVVDAGHVELNGSDKTLRPIGMES